MTLKHDMWMTTFIEEQSLHKAQRFGQKKIFRNDNSNHFDVSALQNQRILSYIYGYWGGMWINSHT